MLQALDDASALVWSKACTAACREAAQRGHLRVLRWLASRKLPIPRTPEMCEQAALSGQTAVLCFLRNVLRPPCAWCHRTPEVLARRGQFPVLCWALRSGCAWHPERCAGAARANGHAAIAAWIEARGRAVFPRTVHQLGDGLDALRQAQPARWWPRGAPRDALLPHANTFSGYEGVATRAHLKETMRRRRTLRIAGCSAFYIPGRQPPVASESAVVVARRLAQDRQSTTRLRHNPSHPTETTSASACSHATVG